MLATPTLAVTPPYRAPARASAFSRTEFVDITRHDRQLRWRCWRRTRSQGHLAGATTTVSTIVELDEHDDATRRAAVRGGRVTRSASWSALPGLQRDDRVTVAVKGGRSGRIETEFTYDLARFTQLLIWAVCERVRRIPRERVGPRTRTPSSGSGWSTNRPISTLCLRSTTSWAGYAPPVTRDDAFVAISALFGPMPAVRARGEREPLLVDHPGGECVLGHRADRQDRDERAPRRGRRVSGRRCRRRTPGRTRPGRRRAGSGTPGSDAPPARSCEIRLTRSHLDRSRKLMNRARS